MRSARTCVCCLNRGTRVGYGCVITAIRSAGDERILQSGTLRPERRRGERTFMIDVIDIPDMT